MKRKGILFAALAALGLVCLWRRWHTTKRQVIGGERCELCGRAGADLNGRGSVRPPDAERLRIQ